MMFFEEDGRVYACDSSPSRSVSAIVEKRMAEGIWRTKDGTDLKISDMTTSHIKNCINFIEKRVEEGVSLYASYIPLFKEELEKREAAKAYANKLYELAGEWLAAASRSESDFEEGYYRGRADGFIMVARNLEKMTVDKGRF